MLKIIYGMLKRQIIRAKTFLICGYKYQAEIDPFRILWVNPNQIIHTAHLYNYGGREELCYVIAGDWDLPKYLFDDKPIVKMMYEHFAHGIEWKKTTPYSEILRRVKERGQSWTKCFSEADVVSRCAYVDNLYFDIKENGYRVPEGILFGVSGIAKGYTSGGEVTVNIGRNGNILYQDGKHRLTIARLLNIPLIPVHVLVRHQQWQNIREELLNINNGRHIIKKFTYIDHPDIVYLLR